MNRILVFIVLYAFVTVACGTTANMIRLKSQSERTDVFSEVPSTEVPSAGYAYLTIKANIKTHIEGYYIGESKESAHGKKVYPFLINIDGQAALWNVEGGKDILPEYVDGQTSRDPEAGEGMRYVLDKGIRLSEGKHRVFFGLPEESYYTAIEVSLKGSGQYALQFKPVYRYKTLPTRIPTFLKGIDKYEAVLTEINVRP